jgi:hypothetical protein
MIHKSISILLLFTMLTTSIGLELFQTAQMLLNGQTIEFALETDEDTKKETESKKLETKDTFDKDILRPYAVPCIFASSIEKAKLSTFYLMQTHQNHLSIQDLPPEA